MDEIFEDLVNLAKGYGELRDAHLYNFKYATATVKVRDGKTITFTADMKEADNDDLV